MSRRKHEGDERSGIDTMLRHASRRHPQALPRSLFGVDDAVEDATWVETQVTARQRRVDRALCVRIGEQRRWLHVEWTVRLDRDVCMRVYEYNHLLTMAAHADGQAARGKGGHAAEPVSVDSVVVVLTGPKRGLPKTGFYRTSSKGEPFSGVRFRIEAIYLRTVMEIEAMGSVFWLVFVPLAVDADELHVARALDALQARTNQRDFEDLAMTMLALASLTKGYKRVMEVITSRVSRNVMMDNYLYRKGQEELWVRIAERRLGRPLTETERGRVESRLLKAPRKVANAVVDLSVEELAAWLAPNGHRRVGRQAA